MLHILANVLNFAVVVGLLVYLGKKPTLEFLKARRARIARMISEGEQASLQAKTTLLEAEQNWKHCEAHVQQAHEDARRTVARHRERTVAAAQLEATRIREEAKLLGQSEQAKSKRGLGRELAEKAIRVATQYLRGLEAPEQHRLVLDVLEKAGNGSHR